MENVVTIYTDGSADNRIRDCGGAAAVIRYKDKYKEVVSGSWSSTTNNRMELLAIIIGLEAVKSGITISLHSDSEYSLTMCKSLMANNLSDKMIETTLNGDLLIRLNKAIQKHSCNIKFNWVKGHSGIEDNERCDILAGEAAISTDITRDIGSGIDECPDLSWYCDEIDKKFVLKDSSFNYSYDMFFTYDNRYVFVDHARKMSKKEITKKLKDIGWKNKDISEYEIDTSYYEKPK